MDYRYDNAYENVYEENTGLFVCSYFAANIEKADSKEEADRKMVIFTENSQDN